MCAAGGGFQVDGATCGFICCGGPDGFGCPISRREFKRDIERLDQDDLVRIYDELRKIQLSTYHYKTDATGTPRHLGFIIDDTRTPYPINSDGMSVDLYGYMSMSVAAIQMQSREIEALRAEVAALRRSRRSSGNHR
jgi:Chaperone of endosialidase